jgi:transcriptional regulator with XRE-family HTH domain
MTALPYGEILTRNIRAARSRADIGQESLAARMRALGFSSWIRQTVGATERGRRRPTAEEILGLAYALQTTISALMAPAEDELVELSSGMAISGASVYHSVGGLRDSAMWWDGDKPVLSESQARGAGTPNPYQMIMELQVQVSGLKKQLEERS